MTVHARSDVAAVTISVAHGGCGEVHSRPVIDGAPVKLWSLTCDGGCENVLRSDPVWASEIADIPETPDEENRRKQQERLGQRDQASATAAALTELSKLGDLPAALARLAEIMSGGPAQPQAVTLAAAEYTVKCVSGHAVASGAAFCSTCGVSMTTSVQGARPSGAIADEANLVPVVADTDQAMKLTDTVGTVVVSAGDSGVIVESDDDEDDDLDSDIDFRAMTVADLNAFARKVGAKVSRNKAAQIQLIEEKLNDQA